MKHVLWLVCLLGAALPAPARAQEEPKVRFRDSERIALIGNEFFDKEQDQSFIETALTARFPDKHLVFRNLGYAGDTVWGEARALCAGWANFGPADQGFERLRKQVQDARPTLIFIAYGMNESFDGPNGLEHFKQGYVRLLNMLEAETKARILLVTPVAHEHLPAPLPDPAEHLANLRLYSDAIIKLAAERNDPVADLFDEMQREQRSAADYHPMTSDGIHLTAFGYWRVAALLEQLLGYNQRESFHVRLDAKTRQQDTSGTRLSDVRTTGENIEFRATDLILPLAPAPQGTPEEFRRLTPPAFLQVTSLSPGRYVLKCDDKPIASATAQQWAQGVAIPIPADAGQEEQLRKTVIAKNAEYFNFWRPENDTYILGYRKHEQGQNAVEIPRFEPLVERKDAEIARLRVPIPHTYMLTLDGK